MRKVPNGFEHRYLAFIDILGLSNFVRSSAVAEKKIATYRRIVNKMTGEKDILAKRNRKVEVSLFSDSIILSTPSLADSADDPPLRSFLWSVRKVALLVLEEQFLVRGAVVKADVIHSPSMLFGEAIIRAYATESRIAINPRILLVGTVGEEVERWSDKLDFARYDADGPLYLHVLRDLEAFVEHCQENDIKASIVKRSESFKVICSVHRLMLDQMRRNRDDPHIFSKYRWFASYLNNHVLKQAPTNNLWPKQISFSPNERNKNAR